MTKHLVFRIYKEFLQFNNKMTIFLMGKRFEQTFLQRIYINVQEAHEQLFNITSHHGNAN